MSDLTGTRFDQWSLSDFAAQCKMQARDQLDPEYSAFMTALASALTTAESKLAELEKERNEQRNARISAATEAVRRLRVLGAEKSRIEASIEHKLAEARAEALEENTEALEAAKARGRQLTGDQPGALVEAMAEVAAEGAKAYLAAIRALKSGGANG